jgi:hypothetical protein
MESSFCSDAFSLYFKRKTFTGISMVPISETITGCSMSMRKQHSNPSTYWPKTVERWVEQTIRSVVHISRPQTIENDDNEAIPEGEMIRIFMEDNIRMAKMLRDALVVCEENRGSATSNQLQLQDILDRTERSKRFLHEVMLGSKSLCSSNWAAANNRNSSKRIFAQCKWIVSALRA